MIFSISITETNWSFYKKQRAFGSRAGEKKKFFKASALGMEKRDSSLSSLPKSSSHHGGRREETEKESRGPRAGAGGGATGDGKTGNTGPRSSLAF